MKYLVSFNELDVVVLRGDVPFGDEEEEKPLAGKQGTIVWVYSEAHPPAYEVEFYRGDDQEPVILTLQHNQLNLVKESMKVIVINEDDGYCSVLNYTVANLKKCLSKLIELDIMDDIDEAKELVLNENATLEELEAIMPTGRAYARKIFIEEIKDWPAYDFQPWD